MLFKCVLVVWVVLLEFDVDGVVMAVMWWLFGGCFCAEEVPRAVLRGVVGQRLMCDSDEMGWEVFWFGCCFLRRRLPTPCHRQQPVYDLGCVPTSDRRRCPCFVVGFRLPLYMYLWCHLFSW